MSQTVIIHHDLGDVVVKVNGTINQVRLKKMIRSTLDQYQEEDVISASRVHAETKQRHGSHYKTSGYQLRIYRLRADMTQMKLAKEVGVHQHHLSEMENNKRPLGKTTAKKLAKILNCNYQELL